MYNTFIFQPLYNGLIYLFGLLPFADAGVVIVIFTIIIKLILLPLSLKASKSQIEMKSIEGDLRKIKENYKDNKEEQTKKTVEYYKEKGINPFAGIFVIILQFPIIIGLYQIFLKSGLPKINTTLLYSFVSVPLSINMMFLNLVDVSQKSLVLALLAGITTFFQVWISTRGNQPAKVSTGGMSSDIASAISTQMKYVFPIIVIFISYRISGALALYWITNNLFAVGQEIYTKKKYHQTPIVV